MAWMAVGLPAPSKMQGGADLEDKAAPVLTHQLHFVLSRCLARELALQHRAVHRQLLLGDEMTERRADDLLRRVAENARDRRIDGGEAKVEVKGGDDVVGVVHHCPIALLALCERRLRGLAVGDVDRGGEQTRLVPKLDDVGVEKHSSDGVLALEAHFQVLDRTALGKQVA